MRYYKLSIGSGIDRLVLESNRLHTNPFKMNPAPLNIQFSIRSFEDADTQIPALIKVFNVDLYTFKNLLKYKGKRIVLEAGFDATSAMCKKLGTPNIRNKALIAGTINNVLGNFSTLDTWIAFSVATFEPQSALLAELEEDEQSAMLQNDFTLQIPPNAPIGLKIKAALSKLLPQNWKIAVAAAFLKELNTSTQSIPLSFSSIPGLFALIKENFNAGVTFDTNKCEAIITHYNEAMEECGILYAPKIIKAGELLSQPEFGGYNKELNVVVSLRPDLRRMQYVTLFGYPPMLGNSIVSKAFISDTADTAKLVQVGTYQIEDIHHNGDYYGADATAWSTQLRLRGMELF